MLWDKICLVAMTTRNTGTFLSTRSVSHHVAQAGARQPTAAAVTAAVGSQPHKDRICLMQSPQSAPVKEGFMVISAERRILHFNALVMNPMYFQFHRLTLKETLAGRRPHFHNGSPPRRAYCKS